MIRPRRRMLLSALSVSTVVGTALVANAAPGTSTTAADATSSARDAAPIVLTGSQLPGWSVPAAYGVAQPYPSGVTGTYSKNIPGSGWNVRTAHNGRIVVPPTAKPAVPVDQVAAYSWNGKAWTEVPVQVDERFPYFLANARSDFGFYSGTDQELTYAWNSTAHTVGEEAWKKMFGGTSTADCDARLASSVAEVQAAIAAGLVTPGPEETAADYLKAMSDPQPGVDDDDEIALRYRDAGLQAPTGQAAPSGATNGERIAVADPLNPGATKYIYLFQKPGGSSFTAANSDVQMTRAADADRWIDRYNFADSDPQKIGTSNTGYGANLTGKICGAAAEAGKPGVPVVGADGLRPSTDRFPSDAMTVTTPTYKVVATGRWMVREFHVRDAAAPTTISHQECVPHPGNAKKPKPPICTTVTEPAPITYGPDLIDRWKGRAFQQSPDSTISVVGFEDEQVNWEANAALLGWRAGPVRAIREVWGADSGTNVTKTETYYRDADVYRYHVRVHPIPPDGLYTSWDYNKGVAARYYNLEKPDGVAIDGINDDTGQVDQLPNGNPAYFDGPDPTFDAPSAVDRPEEVAGRDSVGGLVYVFEFKGATSAVNAAAVPYYRDDACLDDGTGDDPVQRPWPGEASTDSRVKAGYEAANGGAPYSSLICDPAHGKTPFQGAFASHGIHFFATGDSDNATLGVPATEIDGQQWRYSVPMTAPTNVISSYAPNVLAPLQAVATPVAF